MRGEREKERRERDVDKYIYLNSPSQYTKIGSRLDLGGSVVWFGKKKKMKKQKRKKQKRKKQREREREREKRKNKKRKKKRKESIRTAHLNTQKLDLD